MPVIMKTVERAMKAAKDGNVDHGEWSAPVGSERTADDCLLDDPGAAPAERYGYPIFKGPKLSAAGVGAALGRARKNAPELVPHLMKIDNAIHGDDMAASQPDVAASGSFQSMACTGPDGKDAAMSVQSDGSVGKTVATKLCPPGSVCGLSTHEGDRKWMVTSHEDHAHPNMTKPVLHQMSGPKVPSDIAACDASMSLSPEMREHMEKHALGKHSLATVARLHNQSAEWGHSPQLSFSKPGEATEPQEEPPDVEADDGQDDEEQDDMSASQREEWAEKWLGLD